MDTFDFRERKIAKALLSHFDTTYRGGITLRDPRTMCKFIAKTASALQVPSETYSASMKKKIPLVCNLQMQRLRSQIILL
jgi:predicted nucleic acid binding AN1-type Zn finger protein